MGYQFSNSKKMQLFYKTVFVDDVEAVCTDIINKNLDYNLDESSENYYENLFTASLDMYENYIYPKKESKIIWIF